MKKRTDRRKERTKHMLQNSILQLVLEMDYEQITIEEITEKVNLGRTTFYLHFKDKDELMQASLINIWDDLYLEIFSEKRVQRWRSEGIDPRRFMFEHVAEHSRLYKQLFKGKLGGEVLYHFREGLTNIYGDVIKKWQELLKLTPPVPNSVTANYISGALIGLLIWWLNEDMPYTADEIFEMYNQMNVRGPVEAVGIPSQTKSKKR